MQKIRGDDSTGRRGKNFTGFRKNAVCKTGRIVQLLEEIKPDVFGVQEISHYIDADGITHSMVDRNYHDCGFSTPLRRNAYP